jgi:uncharacterized protein (TIGR02466 family)
MSITGFSMGAKPVSADPQVASLFDTPLIVDTLPDALAINEKLKAAILAKRTSDAGVQISNSGGGWHSDLQMLSWGGAAAHLLMERVIRAADKFTVDIRGDGVSRYRWFPEMWANVSPPGASNSLHNHPGAFWSAVYYVDDGYDGSSDPEMGGELVLLDPRMPMIAMNAPDLRFRRPGHPAYHWENRMRPASGRIVIFPAWLSHSVRPYRGPGVRISIAINLSAVPLSIPTRPAAS